MANHYCRDAGFFCRSTDTPPSLTRRISALVPQVVDIIHPGLANVSKADVLAIKTMVIGEQHTRHFVERDLVRALRARAVSACP